MTAVTIVPGIGAPVVPLRRPPTRDATPRGRRATPASYWRRRLGVLLVAAGALVVTGQAGAALGGSSPADPERRPTMHAQPDRVVTVRPGDTLWSIAGRVEPGEDPRPLVDRLSAARHGAPLQPGETLHLPA
jgi:hypothetical protein